MNSQFPISNIPAAPKDYAPEYFNRVLKTLEETFRRARSPGVIEAQRANFSNLPTSATGLRSGDLWNNSGAVEIVP